MCIDVFGIRNKNAKRHTLNYEGIWINFNNKTLFPVDGIKYLGMYIDKYLSWNVHIQQLSKKLSRANAKTHKQLLPLFPWLQTGNV